MMDKKIERLGELEWVQEIRQRVSGRMVRFNEGIKSVEEPGSWGIEIEIEINKDLRDYLQNEISLTIPPSIERVRYISLAPDTLLSFRAKVSLGLQDRESDFLGLEESRFKKSYFSILECDIRRIEDSDLSIKKAKQIFSDIQNSIKNDDQQAVYKLANEFLDHVFKNDITSQTSEIGPYIIDVQALATDNFGKQAISKRERFLDFIKTCFLPVKLATMQFESTSESISSMNSGSAYVVVDGHGASSESNLTIGHREDTIDEAIEEASGNVKMRNRKPGLVDELQILFPRTIKNLRKSYRAVQGKKVTKVINQGNHISTQAVINSLNADEERQPAIIAFIVCNEKNYTDLYTDIATVLIPNNIVNIQGMIDGKIGISVINPQD